MQDLVRTAALLLLLLLTTTTVWQSDERRIRETLLAELQPLTLRNCVLERFGSANDGGYLMCGNLVSGVESAYSYGIGWQDDWGCEVSTRFGVPVHQYDCFDPNRPVCNIGRFVFHAECVGDRKETVDGRTFDTLANQIASNGDRGKRIIVKLDVEGAEWDVLMGTPDDVLARIDQLPMELHGVNEQRFVVVVRKLKRTFHLVNLHFNNYSCAPELAPLPARAYQVLFVNKRHAVVDASRRVPATLSPLNAPDDPSGPDCQLRPQEGVR